MLTIMLKQNNAISHADIIDNIKTNINSNADISSNNNTNSYTCANESAKD